LVLSREDEATGVVRSSCDEYEAAGDIGGVGKAAIADADLLMDEGLELPPLLATRNEHDVLRACDKGGKEGGVEWCLCT
jgi:hypothetical protein